MVRCRIVFFLMFVSSVAFSQTFPRFRLIQLQQSDTVGQMIMSDTANNAFWSSDLRVQDSVFYIFGQPYSIDSTRLNVAGDSVIYFNNGVQIGGDVLPTGLIDSTRLDNDTLKYYQNGVVIGFDLIVTTIDSTRLNDTKDTLLYYQNGTLIAYDLIDGDATNEIQSITQFNIINDSLYITLSEDGTYGVDVSPYLDNTDTSGFNRQFYINSDTLYIVDDLGTKFVDLVPYLNTDEQTLSIVNDTLYISNSNGVDLSAYLDDKDEQTLSLSNDTLYISNGNSVYLDYVDTSGYNRNFVLNNDTLLITDDNGTLSVVLDQFTNTDTSGYNRTLIISNDSLYLSDDNSILSIDLTPYLDNTDTSGYNTAFEIINDTLYIQDGSSRKFVSLNPYLDNTDTSGYNIDFAINNDTITLTDGLGTKTIVLPYSNTDTSGYNKNFTLQDSVLYLQDGDTTIALNIKETYDNTDTSGYNQSLTLLGNTLYLTDGQSTLSVDISQFNDNTDTSGYNSNFYIDANRLYIVDGQNSYNVDLSPYLDNTDTSGILKAFYILNDSIYISDGNVNARADLSPYLDNTDTSGYNISLELVNGFLILRDGTTTLQEDLNIFFDNTDTSGYNKQFYVSGNRIYLEDGAGQLFVQATDYDKQNLSLQSDTLYIERGNYVVLPLGTINTDDQVISISNDTIFLENGGFVILPNNNTDTSGYNKTFVLGDSILYLLDYNSLLTVNLKSAFDNTDDQQLSKVDSIITLEDGGSVILLDDDPTNELQNLSSVHDTLYIAVDETTFIPYERYIIYLTNGDSVVIYDKYYDPDYDPTNELQQLGILNDTIYLTLDTNFIDLTPYLDNTDEQQLSKSNDTIYLERGGNVLLLDDDPTNELQDISVVNDTLYISNGNGVYLDYSDIDSTRLNGRGDTLIYYYNDSIVRKDPLNVLIDVVSGCVGGLTESTDVYALFDMSGSVVVSNVVHVISVLTSWHAQYKIDNPNYTGNLYTIPVQDEKSDANQTEEWLDYLYDLRNNTLLLDDRVGSTQFPQYDVIDSVMMLPPWLDGTGSFVVPNEILLIGFVNEANPDYHNVVSQFSTYEPTDTFNAHLNRFLDEYAQMTFFQGILYPLHQDLRIDDGFILHALAALKATTLTDTQIQEAFGDNYPEVDTADDFSILNTVNNYTVPLENYGWTAILDKSSPASISFTDSSFNAEINTILANNAINYISVIEDYSNNILTLRSIGSRTLDIAVDSSGCISIEYTRGDIAIYADSITILGDGSMQSPLFVDTNLIVTTKALIDSLASIPTFTDSTRLSDDAVRLEYFQNGLLIGFDTLTRGDGLFQEKWYGDGSSSVLIITQQNGQLPNDPNDILLYRNGIYLGSEFIQGLTGNQLQLTFTPEVGDIIMATWFVNDVYTSVTAGIDSVFTDMYILGNGLPSNPLTIDTMYTASKAYVDSQIAASGTGTITGVNEADDPVINYGLDGGASVGKVNLKVDTSVIAAKQWVINQDYSLIDSVIGSYGLLGGGEQDNVTLIVDTSLIVSKEFLVNMGYTNANELITFYGDVTEVSGTTDFDLNVLRSTNVKGGNTGAILYQQAANTTTNLPLPDNGVLVNEYILMDGLAAPDWLHKDSILVGSALKLDTSRTFQIAGDAVAANGAAVQFDGTAGVQLEIDGINASFLTTGTVPQNRLSGYYNIRSAITDEVEWDSVLNKPTTFTPSTHTHPWTEITSTPTTLSGYGITDAVTNNTNQTISGVKTFSSNIVGDLSGTATNANNVDVQLVPNTVDYYLTMADGSGYKALKRTADIKYNDNTDVFTVKNYVFESGESLSGKDNYVLTYDEQSGKILLEQSSASGGSTLLNSITFNNSGSGASSGLVFDGSSAATVSYNTVGAPSTTGTNASGTWPISISGNAATSTTATTATNASYASVAGSVNYVSVSSNSSTIKIGYQAGYELNGANSTIIGFAAYTRGNSNSTKYGHTVIGAYNLPNNIGSSITSIGADITSASTNGLYFHTEGVFIGRNVTLTNTSSTNQIVIGHQAVGRGDNKITIGNSNSEDLKVNNYIFNINEDLTGKDGHVLTLNSGIIGLEPISSSLSNSITFNNSGTGSASGLVFDGSSAATVSYNTIGAPKTDGTDATGTWNIDISGNAASSTNADKLYMGFGGNQDYSLVFTSAQGTGYQSFLTTAGNFTYNPSQQKLKFGNYVFDGSQDTTGKDGYVLTLNSGIIGLEAVSGGATTINNNADNRIITGSNTANTLEGESGLIYSSGTLKIQSTTSYSDLLLHNSSSGTTNGDGAILQLSGSNIFLGNQEAGAIVLQTTTAGNPALTLQSNGTVKIDDLAGVSDVGADENGVLQAVTSDTTLKTNIVPNKYGLEKVMDIETIKFNWKDKDSKGSQNEVGFNAQNLQKVIPEATYTIPSNGKLGIKDDAIIATLTKAIQEQQKMINELRAEIEKLKQ